MAAGFSCGMKLYSTCMERTKVVSERRWVVLQYKCNHSAFNGYRRTPSDYSTVKCLECGATGRTKAAYVGELVRLGRVRSKLWWMSWADPETGKNRGLAVIDRCATP